MLKQKAQPLSLAVNHRFSSFDEFTDATALWDIDFRQLGHGNLNADLLQAVSPN
jgi:hypothetical protein